MRPLLTLIALGLSLLMASPVLAESLVSPSYQIRLGNFNMTSGTKSSSSYSLTDTVGQTAAGAFSSSGYALLSGFQYIYSLYPFSFSISDLSVDFGALNLGSFATSSHNLVVSTPRLGYSVTAYEVERLKSGTNYISDTTCDSGTCTETTAGVWSNTSIYGFGYNMTGSDIPATFTDSTYFRPFPDLSLGDSPAVVMSSTVPGEGRTATVTYKVNISASQAAGDYSTQIVYIATPTY